MMTPSPAAARAASEIRRIAVSGIRVEQRAAQMLAVLGEAVPFQAGRIALLDPQTREHVLLTEHGYDEATRSYLASPAYFRQVQLVGVDRSRRPVCARDNPVPQAELTVWREYFLPAGFRDGLLGGLFSTDGRYVGVLGVTTEAHGQPSHAARDLVAALTPRIAAAVDPMRSVVALAGIVGNALAGVVLTRNGDTWPLSGLAGHPVLRTGSDVLTVAARQLAAGQVSARFLWPERGHHDGEPSPYQGPAGSAVRADHQDGQPKLLRVTVLSCAAQPLASLTGVVLLSEPGDLFGLTHRELALLGLFAEDVPLRRIVGALRLTPGQLRAAIERITAALGVADRSAATILAVSRGLYVPARSGPGPVR